MGPTKRIGPLAAARARGRRPGAFQCPFGALLATLRRGQYASGELHHARAIFPLAAPTNARRTGSPGIAEAADRDVSQELAAASESDFDRCRLDGRIFLSRS